MVTAEMLYHAILDSTDDLFPKMRLCDIYYNYRWLNNKRTDRYIGDEGLPNIDRNIVPRLNIYTNHFDKYIKDFFPNSKNIVINKITSCFNLSQLEAMILFERWKTFYFIEYGPYDEWSQMKPKDTLTIEQFKERLSISKIKIKKDTNTGLLYLEGSEIFIGLVLGNEMPQHPMISQFISSDSKTYWLLHEEGEIQALSILCDF
jgi:hypothetical protein